LNTVSRSSNNRSERIEPIPVDELVVPNGFFAPDRSREFASIAPLRGTIAISMKQGLGDYPSLPSICSTFSRL